MLSERPSVLVGESRCWQAWLPNELAWVQQPSLFISTNPEPKSKDVQKDVEEMRSCAVQILDAGVHEYSFTNCKKLHVSETYTVLGKAEAGTLGQIGDLFERTLGTECMHTATTLQTHTPTAILHGGYMPQKDPVKHGD